MAFAFRGWDGMGRCAICVVGAGAGAGAGVGVRNEWGYLRSLQIFDTRGARLTSLAPFSSAPLSSITQTLPSI